MFTIVRSPNVILRTPVQPVDLPVVKLQSIISEMKKTLVAQKDPEGVGLAANQVNLPYKLFLARFDVKKNSPIHIFINPEIISHSDQLQPEDDDKKPTLEGCLSLPKYYGVVKRWKTVELKYQNEKLEANIETFSGFPATVIQHEMDHLTGHIFVERILEQQGKLYKITKASKSAQGRSASGGETWDEVEI